MKTGLPEIKGYRGYASPFLVDGMEIAVFAADVATVVKIASTRLTIPDVDVTKIVPVVLLGQKSFNENTPAKQHP